MNWLAAKVFLKKAWVFIKSYWQVPALLVYTLFLVYFFRQDTESVMKVMKSSTKRYEEEINAIKDSHENEIRKRDEITRKYSNVLSAIEKKYEEDKLELNRQKKKKLLDLIEKYYDDNSSLAREISEKFGVEYVEREEVE